MCIIVCIYIHNLYLIGVLPVLGNKTRNGFYARIDDTEGGLLQTSFVISFMLFSPLFGYLGDRCTRKYIMAIGIFLWSAFVLAGSFSLVRVLDRTDNKNYFIGVVFAGL